MMHTVRIAGKSSTTDPAILQKTEAKMDLKTAKKIAWVVNAFLVIAAILLIIMRARIWLYLLIAGCVAYFIVHYSLLRCPYCGRPLSRIAMFKNFTTCPFCGKELEL